MIKETNKCLTPKKYNYSMDESLTRTRNQFEFRKDQFNPPPSNGKMA